MRDWEDDTTVRDAIAEAEATGYRSGYLDGLGEMQTRLLPASELASEADRTMRRAMLRTIGIEAVLVAAAYALGALMAEALTTGGDRVRV